jgi:hypothetical protein
VHHALTRVAQEVELAISVFEIESNRGRGFCCCTPHLGQLELDAVGNVDANSVLLARGRALNRAPIRLEDTGNDDAGRARADVHLIVDGLKKRRVNGQT